MKRSGKKKPALSPEDLAEIRRIVLIEKIQLREFVQRAFYGIREEVALTAKRKKKRGLIA